MRMLQTIAPAIFSVTVFVLIRFQTVQTKGGFLLAHNFHVRTHVNFTRVNKKEAIYERP